MTPDVLTPDGFAALQQATLEKRITVYPARAWYPSQVGHPCDRYLVWQWTRSDERAPHDYVLQSIFDEGNTHAPDVYRRLEAMGFDVIRESDRPTQWKLAGGLVISGRIDGKLRGFKGDRFPSPVVLEIKTTQAHTWQALDSIEDIRRHREHYIRAYAEQGNLYCFLEELEHGVMVLKNKATGLLKLIPFQLDYQRGEELLTRIERLHAQVRAAVDPEPIPYDDSICGRCGFLGLCYPPRDFGAGAIVLQDAALLDDLHRELELKPQHSEYDSLAKANRKRLRQIGTFEQAILGDVAIVRKEVPVKAYNVAERTDVRFELKRLNEKVEVEG